MDPERVIPGGVNSAMRRVPGVEGLVVAGTSGATITDSEGRVYTDYHCAFGPILLGHRDPDVDRAVAEATRSHAHTEEDVDRLLEATERAVETILARAS